MELVSDPAEECARRGVPPELLQEREFDAPALSKL